MRRLRGVPSSSLMRGVRLHGTDMNASRSSGCDLSQGVNSCTPGVAPGHTLGRKTSRALSAPNPSCTPLHKRFATVTLALPAGSAPTSPSYPSHCPRLR